METEKIRTRIIIFAKAPSPGQVKTRLIPALGAHGAARLAERMLAHTLEEAQKAIRNETALVLELCVAPDAQDPYWQQFNYSERFVLSGQGGGDLGDRLYRAANKAICNGERVILTGTDCPGIDAQRLKNTAAELGAHDAVMRPASDGGYVLLGLGRCDRFLFSGIPWSTSRVAGLTLERLGKLGFSVNRLGELHDIDDPEDLRYLPEHWLVDI